MDHVVYIDVKSKEIEKLIDGTKTMIIRGASGRKLPHGRVFADDVLYFIHNNAEGNALAKCKVSSVINTNKMMSDESIAFVSSYQDKLLLTDKQFKRWAGKRYIVLIEICNVEAITPIAIDKSNYGNMDDWLPVGDINTVRK
ncbi:MAG: hypothetical protein KAQ68_06095 [Clostridiales bacterium]|nr:hypothetical protein [Clostridiales bacterium]